MSNEVDSGIRPFHTPLGRGFWWKGGEMPTFRAPAQLSRAAPILCPQCGGRAPLIRMSPDSFTRGKMETWTYECSACGNKTEKSVEAGGA